MSDIENNTTDVTTTPAAPKTPVVLTKAEQLAKIDKEIERLKTKRYNVENDIVVVKEKKEVALPEVGAEVSFNYGRRTPTTEPVLKIGTVVAVKPAAVGAEGKKLPAQIKVRVGEGFDAEFVVIYPAQVVSSTSPEEKLPE